MKTEVKFHPIDNDTPATIKAMAPERSNVYALAYLDGGANYGFCRSVIIKAMAPAPLFENVVDGTVAGKEEGKQYLLAFGIL